MDNTHRFDGMGALYAKARPRYAAALFAHFKSTLHFPSVFADVGSGTGIFTEQLLRCGYRVFAVEPNDDMREQAERRLARSEGFRSVNGSDADMKLPDHSVDYVTAAQAFHWFDAEAFRRECRRVLVPDGKVILVYNARDKKAACTRALAALHRKFAPAFHGFSNGITDGQCRAFFAGGCEVFRADNTQVYDRQGYLDRVLSSSYALRESDDRYAEYRKEISAIFDCYSAADRLTVPTETVAYIGKIDE